MAETRGRRRKKKQQSEYFFDYSLLFIVLFLLGFGLIMIYSASSYEAYDSYGDAAYYMKKQLIANIIGLVFMMVIANIPYTFWERFATLGYVVSMILIFLVKTVAVSWAVWPGETGQPPMVSDRICHCRQG